MGNREIIIGSHNTMSYLPPKHWWMRPFRFIARCQANTLAQQIESGVSAVDLRVFFDRKGNVCFAHGAMTFKSEMSFAEVLGALPHGTIVRVLLEKVTHNDDEKKFVSLCKNIERTFSELVFIGGYRKRPWRKLFVFTSEWSRDMTVHQHVSSMSDKARWYEKAVPVLFHKRCGHETPEKGINLYDFV